MPRPLLGADEHLVRHLRVHAKVLVGPAVAFIGLAAALGLGLGVLPGAWARWGEPALWALFALAALQFSVIPLLRWLTTTFTITTRRVIVREGIVSREGHDLPLQRISNVSSRRGLLDRLLGCGTLTLTTSAEDPLVLRGIPDVELVHLELADLLHVAGPGEQAG